MNLPLIISCIIIVLALIIFPLIVSHKAEKRNNLKSEKDDNFKFFSDLENKKYKLLYLLNSDNFNFKKDNEFIVYQGSHGDRGAEIADVILPSPAFTEQKGLYSNLEGRIQEFNKASYPTGSSIEDWKVFNMILNKLNHKNLFNNLEKIREELFTLIPNFSNIDSLPKKIVTNFSKVDSKFINEKITINKIDYYYTNAISRSSKTMSQCRDIKQSSLKDGTIN